jgi:hypothetical protein
MPLLRLLLGPKEVPKTSQKPGKPKLGGNEFSKILLLPSTSSLLRHR